MKSELPSSRSIEEIVSSVDKKEYHSFANAFSQMCDGEYGDGWNLLAQIFNFNFVCKNPSAPFRPMLEGGGQRSMLPEDLSDEQLKALRSTLQEVSDPEYRSRIGDILWLRSRDATAARIAVKAYLESGSRLENPERWVRCMERYERAIRLSKLLGRTEPLLTEALNHLLARVLHYNGEDSSWFTKRGLSLLYEFEFGDSARLADLAAKAAGLAKNQNDLRRAWELHDLTACFHRRQKDFAKAEDAMRAKAECMVEQAEAREADGSYIASHRFWNDAIQAYRRVPESTERIQELRQRLHEAGQKMKKEMKSIEFKIDISEDVKRSQELVRNREFENAICTLAAMIQPINPIRFRREIEELIKNNPIQATIESDIFDAAGRKVDVRPAAFTNDPEQHERAMQGFMAQYVDPYRMQVATGRIAPAMRQIMMDHSVDDHSIGNFVDQSGLVPLGREPIFVRGIRLGFELDLSTALHLLVPQIENAFRFLLYENGTITTALDAIGIEEAWALGRVLSEDDIIDVLGDAHVYELRSLLLGKPGVNIRNLIAHGLLTDDQLSNHNALYLWWLFVRLVIISTPQFRSFVERYSKKME